MFVMYRFFAFSLVYLILFNLLLFLLGQYLVLYSALLSSSLDYYSLVFFLCLLSMANKDSFIHSFIHSKPRPQPFDYFVFDFKLSMISTACDLGV